MSLSPPHARAMAAIPASGSAPGWISLLAMAMLRQPGRLAGTGNRIAAG